VKLINLIIFALEQSLPAKEWKPFLRKLNNLKQMILGVPGFENRKDVREDEENYQNAIAYLRNILENYKNYLIV
jgi:hypothetical protein